MNYNNIKWNVKLQKTLLKKSNKITDDITFSLSYFNQSFQTRNLFWTKKSNKTPIKISKAFRSLNKKLSVGPQPVKYDI